MIYTNLRWQAGSRGFTLIELLVVISIISLLSSIVLSSLNSARDKGRLAGARSFSAQMDRVASDMTTGMWDFNECSGSTVADRSGLGNTGTLVNSPTWSADTPSGVGCSMSFNGVNQYVSIGNITFPVNYSVSAWVKTAVSSGAMAIIDNISCGGPACLDFGLSSGKVRLGYDFGPGFNGNATVSDGKWHHVAVTFDGVNTNLYVDGTFDKTSTVQGARAESVHCGQIGAYYCGIYGNFFSGLIDDVHVFGKTLVASEVQAIFAKEAREEYLAGR